MVNDIGGITSQLLSMALDASSLRHRLIANNIANVDSQGYVPLRLDFESQLQEIRQRLLGRAGDTELAGDLQKIQPQVVQDSGTDVNGGAGVKLDREMVDLASNVVHYQALLKAMSKNTSVIRLAVNEGRK